MKTQHHPKQTNLKKPTRIGSSRRATKARDLAPRKDAKGGGILEGDGGRSRQGIVTGSGG